MGDTMPDTILHLTVASPIRLVPTDEQAAPLTAAVSVLTAAPSGQLPDIPPGEYRWETAEGSALLFTDVEVFASTGRAVLESAGYGHRALPLPYQANLDTSTFGHEGAENVGRIDTLIDQKPGPYAAGFLTVSDSGEGREYVLAVAMGNVPGVSADVAVLEHTMVYEQDEMGVIVDAVVVASRWEIMGQTGTPFPAFADARVTVEGVDVPGILADVPADEDAEDTEEEPVDEPDDEPAEALAASAATKPPAAWFADPTLDHPTPLTVDDNGRVYGHIAPWDSPDAKACHVGFSDRCVCPPKSPDGAYPYMMSGGTVSCSDGTQAQVATVAYLGGHPDDDGTAPWTTIKAAYDNPANAGLQVTVGEDRHGIWLAGRVAPTRTAAEVEVIRACGISGHWRTRIQGDRVKGPRLIGACCVIAEGFPKAVITAAADGADLPAVAAGPRARYDGNELVSLVAANGSAGLAARKGPATLSDVDGLAARLTSLEAANVALRARLVLLDGPVREAAQSIMG